ncbi:VWA domain-containing protein [Rhodobacteraceae bacterium M382]|nr:VWA domain-containing protein [Rhodobacteraceae bacterium M382]
MGSRSSSTQTVGYRYSLGAHLALCHGPVDAIREILVDDKTAWSIGEGAAPVAGTGVGAVQSFGTFNSVSGFPADEKGTWSMVMIQGPGAPTGLSIGQALKLELQTDGTSLIVTVRSIANDGEGGLTTLLVDPRTVSFALQSVTFTSADPVEAPAPEPEAEAPVTNQIRINKPDLFGGESREGGIVGDIDVLMGEPSQGQNDYLAARAGANVPGYRGLCSLVLRQVYLGLNPYLKPWAVRLTRVLAAEDGTEQWYPEKAQIIAAARIGDAAIYIAMDTSGSMSGARMAAQMAAVSTLIGEISDNANALNDIEIVTYNATITGSITRRNADAVAYGELKSWVDGLSTATAFGTNFGAAVSQASAFFAGAGSKRRVLIFVTDGAPSPASSLETAKATLAGISAVDVFAFNIALSDISATAQLDNTPVDGVPVVPAGDADALVASVRAAFGRGPDMNPAHIVRECLTNSAWGLGYGDADIGASFNGAADTLFTEGFGLSLLWQRESTIEDFIADILSHIDAYLYVDRRSGRWELRLIRDDFDPATLPIFDESNVVDWGELGRREAADQINSVTVKFSDARTDQTGSVSVTDTALVQLMGQVISTTVDYPGIRFESLAVRVAERDLRGLSAPLLSGEITVSRAGSDLDPGDVIILDSDRKGLDALVVRVVEIDHGDGRANGVRLRIVEDVFSLGETALIGGETSDPVPLITAPQPLSRRIVQEAPYWMLVQELGHTQADTLLAEDPDTGVLIASGERPSSDALSTQVWIDPGTGYAPEEPVEFVPTAVLAADVTDDPTERVLAVSDWTGLEDLTTGTLAAIGGEFVRIDGISATSLTVGRGCLDTLPMNHLAGTPVICWQHMANATATQFAAGETIAVKMLPQTGFGTLPLAQAPADQVVLASRAIRPLPPGNFRGDGLFVQMLSGTEAALSWAHRDRLAQTSSVFDDYTGPDIGPEPGVAYEVRIHWVDTATGATLEPAAAVINAAQATSLTLTDADYPQPPIGVEMAAIRLRAVRDGYEDRAFREYRVLIGGKVQITDQELAILFSGPGVDVAWQDLILGFTGPGIDLLHQHMILSFEAPEMGISAQELVIEMLP